MGEEKPDKIFPAFYIGSMEVATNLDMLFEYDITHIVTVATGIKPKWPRKFKYLALDVLDMDNQDIKQHFARTFDFIDSARQDGAVLVHCVAGVSRSATVSAAYIMRKLNVSADDAMGLVRDARPSVCPNDGFLRQLKAYELELASKNAPAPEPEAPAEPSQDTPSPSSSSSSSPQPEQAQPSSTDSFPSTHTLESALPHTNTIPNTANTRFCCRMCGTYLFNDTELIPHDAGSGQTSFDWRKRANSGHIECTSHFLQEPQQFGDTSELEGKLTCPKCNSRFGGWQWAGAQCSCGVWVTPAFQVPKTRVDAKIIIK